MAPLVVILHAYAHLACVQMALEGGLNRHPSTKHMPPGLAGGLL